MNYLTTLTRLFSLPLFLFAFFGGHVLLAQSPQIEVTKINFDDCFAAADEDWIQMEVDLEGSENPLPDALNEDYLTNVSVEAIVAYENPSRNAESRFVFFTSKLEISVLKSGEQRTVYFFMPGDAVKMLNLDRRPPYAFLRFEVEGEEVEPNSSHLYGKMQPQFVEDFTAMAERESGRTEGFLIPITEAPSYVLDNVRFSELPPFVRKTEDF